MTMRYLTESEVKFTYSIEPEDLEVRGNYMCTEDPVQDKADEDAIIARLDKDDTLAWCYLTVRASWNNFTSTASIGGCSFGVNTTEKEVWEEYGAELRSEALEMLNLEIQTTKKILDTIEV